MLAVVEISYASKTGAKFAELGREAYAKLQEELSHLDLPEWKEGSDSPNYWYRDRLLIDLASDGMLLAAAGVEFTVKRFKGTYKVAGTSPTGDTYNLHVAIPAIGLLSMNEVRVEEDICTDRLQGLLDEGWRIIAVCPPDAQRRPDYILGRSSEMKDRSSR